MLLTFMASQLTMWQLAAASKEIPPDARTKTKAVEYLQQLHGCFPRRIPVAADSNDPRRWR
jgi:hypothetical protein